MVSSKAKIMAKERTITSHETNQSGFSAGRDKAMPCLYDDGIKHNHKIPVQVKTFSLHISYATGDAISFLKVFRENLRKSA
jgi:hypothetical protein